MITIITFPKSEVNGPRLTAQEVLEAAAFTYQIHNHLANAPQQPIWWERTERRFES